MAYHHKPRGASSVPNVCTQSDIVRYVHMNLSEGQMQRIPDDVVWLDVVLNLAPEWPCGGKHNARRVRIVDGRMCITVQKHIVHLDAGAVSDVLEIVQNVFYKVDTGETTE